MYHNYYYQVICMVNGARLVYNGMYTNMRSKAEAIATLKRLYSNIVDYDVWEA